jgi:dihydroorotase
MMNRRQLVCGAGAALFTHIPRAYAATYDLIIRGGRVIDPSAALDATRDVAISGGRIVAVEASIAGDATETIDARGKIVVPGLIDIHTHAGRSKEGPPMCLQDGVTAWVDAGSGGADNIDAVAAIARGAPQMGRCLVNIARTGVVTPSGELHDLNAANVALARGAI